MVTILRVVNNYRDVIVNRIPPSLFFVGDYFVVIINAASVIIGLPMVVPLTIKPHSLNCILTFTTKTNCMQCEHEC